MNMEETQCRDSGQTCRHEWQEWHFGHRRAAQRPDVACDVSREGKSIVLSPSKQRQQLYPPRFLHPAHRHSIPTHRPLFCAAGRWTLALDVPEDEKIDRLAHPKTLKWVLIPVVSPFLTSLLLWVLSEVTSQVNIHESANKEKKRGSAFKSTEAALWWSHWGLQHLLAGGGHEQPGSRQHNLLILQLSCSRCHSWK